MPPDTGTSGVVDLHHMRAGNRDRSASHKSSNVRANFAKSDIENGAIRATVETGIADRGFY
jgi:hypothetical protein